MAMSKICPSCKDVEMYHLKLKTPIYRCPKCFLDQPVRKSDLMPLSNDNSISPPAAVQGVISFEQIKFFDSTDFIGFT